MSRAIKRIGKLTFSKCVDMSCRSGKQWSRLGPNTELLECLGDDDTPLMYKVFLHGSCIMELYHDGRVLLYTRQHQTNTTKQRLCALSGRTIYSKNCTWKIGSLKFYEGVNVGKVQSKKDWLERMLMDGKDKEASAMRDKTKELADDTPIEIVMDYIQDHS